MGIPPGASVIVCDSHPLVQAGICAALTADTALTITHRVTRRAELPGVLRAWPEAFVVIEERMFYSGFRAAPNAVSASRTVVSVDRLDGERLLSLIDCGVRAMVLRSGPAEDILRAVWAVVAGDGFIAPVIVEPLLATVRTGGPRIGRLFDGETSRLTAREREVLDLLYLGASNREIAKELYITEKTVKFHVSNLLAKARLRSRSQLIARLGGPPSPVRHRRP